MKKIKNLYIDKDKHGNNFIVIEAEDGTLYKEEQVPTGSCWVLFWKEQKHEKDVKELTDLILKVQLSNSERRER
jgi:hypothetical protein